MTSIASGIFEVTIGMLVRKARDKAAEKLKDGDLSDETFRKLVMREIDDIKTKLDGLARKDLLASLSYFRGGMVYLCQLFAKKDYSMKNEKETVKRSSLKELNACSATKLKFSIHSISWSNLTAISNSSLAVEPTPKLVSFAKRLQSLDLAQLDYCTEQLLRNAKKRFEEAREKATDAFSNEALSIADRILAMKLRVSANILEHVTDPAVALNECRMHLEELHSMPAVQEIFKVQMRRSVKHWFKKEERGEIIATVCHVNRVVYNLTQMVGAGKGELFLWPSVDVGERKVDPLHDPRLTKKLAKLNMEACCVTWSFGQNGEVGHWLNKPSGIATNTQNQFIVADEADGNVKLFSSSGKFLYFLCPPADEVNSKLTFVPRSVATDRHNNVYVLAELRLKKGGTSHVAEEGVYVFTKHGYLHHSFPLMGGFLRRSVASIAVNDNKVFVLPGDNGIPRVDVYKANGQLLHGIGEGILKFPRVLATASDGRILVSEWGTGAKCIHVFSAQGDHICDFEVQGDKYTGAIAFHAASEHVVVSSWNPNDYRGQISIYTTSGDFVQTIGIDTENNPWLLGVVVTAEGRIAVTSFQEGKVYVV